MIKNPIVLCMLLVALNGLFAQENIVKAATIIGNTGVQYERSLSDHFSVIGQIGYSKITTTVNDVESKSTGFGYYLESRYYFSSKKDLMEGWHVGPFYNSFMIKDKLDLKTKISSFGLSTGYQWVLDSQLTIGIIFGGGSLNIDSDDPTIDFFLGDIGFLPHLGFTLGYNF
ncbi:DUF3575 domain-containing protein [Flavobacteriaceae bacterium]|jgi:hypothetical protein|nr:DUF3575 domain-containing protein [Flavobacteriaceae bacterium]MDB4108408.1 DUF3575 domain-containing protein [Flavobacteriaceae bacterium]MDB4183002.1 DUF3575 domain-containing protein [Flavobacteriaceae bacterium]